MKIYFCMMVTFVLSSNGLFGREGIVTLIGAGESNDIVISNVNHWTTDLGSEGMVHTIGIVENKSPITHYKVRLRVIYLDAQNKPLDVEGWLSEYKNELNNGSGSAIPADIATIETVMIPAKGRSYFHQYRSVSKLKGKVHSVRIEIERVDKTQREYKMEIKDLVVKPEKETKTLWDGSKVTNDNGMRVSGTLINKDAAPADVPKIAIIYYGADGKIWGDKVIDCTFSGLNSIKLSKYGPMQGGEELNFVILCDHPQIDLKGKEVKISKVEIFGYKDISYF